MTDGWQLQCKKSSFRAQPQTSLLSFYASITGIVKRWGVFKSWSEAFSQISVWQTPFRYCIRMHWNPSWLVHIPSLVNSIPDFFFLNFFWQSNWNRAFPLSGMFSIRAHHGMSVPYQIIHFVCSLGTTGMIYLTKHNPNKSIQTYRHFYCRICILDPIMCSNHKAEKVLVFSIERIIEPEDTGIGFYDEVTISSRQ